MVVAALTAGCGTSNGVTSTLRDWSQRKLETSINYGPDQKTVQSIRIDLNNDVLANGADAPQTPPLGADVRATLDGRPMVVDRGNNSSGFPTFTLDAGNGFPDPNAATTTFVVTDSSGSITAVWQNFFAPRTITLVSPVGGALQVGGQVQVGWSPSTDSVSPSFFKLLTASTLAQCGNIVVPPSAANPDPNVDVDPTFVYAKGTLTFTVPADWHCGSAAPGQLSVTVGVVPGVSRCEGVAACDTVLGISSDEPPLTVTTP
jgi:hypothetical protein